MSGEKDSENPGTEANGPPESEKPEAGKSRSPNSDDWKALAKSHEANLAAEREKMRQMEARMRQLEATAMGQNRPPIDPTAQAFQGLQERAMYGDPDAAAVVEVGRIAARAQIDANLTKQMVKAKVSGEEWDEVEILIRNSGYQMSVEDAKKRARGVHADKYEAETASLREKLAQKEKELEAERTRVRVPSMGTIPAAVPPDATSISAAQYKAVLAKGGDAAKDLKARVNGGKVQVDWDK